MPAHAGIHLFLCQPNLYFDVDVDSRLRGYDVVTTVTPVMVSFGWIPAFAGMTWR
jgi:hypothetical protein